MSQLLLVLSDPRRRAAVAAFLAAAGSGVIEAEGGLHALTQVERQVPAAVLADPTLADLGADELLEILRSEPATAEVPFFLVAPDPPPWLAGPHNHLLSGPLTSRALAHAALEGARHARLADGEAVSRRSVQGAVHLRGSLELLSLLDLLGSLSALQKSGCVTVTLAEAEALLLLHGGEIIHAEFLDLWGEAALQRVFAETGRHPAHFAFEAQPGGVMLTLPHSIQVPSSRLLLELAVHLDHLRADRSTSS